MKILDVDENKLLEDFRQLSDKGKAEVMERLKTLLNEQEKGDVHTPNKPPEAREGA
jgi:hypothetical protein